MSTIQVPERFKRVIALHVVKNLFTNAPFRPPLILGIQGGSGVGKTLQCQTCLEEMGVKAFLISGGQLESGIAGEPAQLVRQTYIAASRSIENRECNVAVLLLNDVDTGLGNWGDKVQTTINTQTVYGELMHLVDYPNGVQGIKTHRIPIILTGNDFTKLYEPLVRAGRMTSFIWEPTSEEKALILQGIFPDLNSHDYHTLVAQFPDQPIAFFAHLRSTLIDNILWREIENCGINTFIHRITRNGEEPNLTSIYRSFNLNSLITAGQELKNSGQLVNHLGK
jgi:ATP-dependent 26S proteasome regulatory subunit